MPEIVTPSRKPDTEKIPDWVKTAQDNPGMAVRLVNQLDFFCLPKSLCEKIWAYGRQNNLRIKASIIDKADVEIEIARD